ncbi:tetratricopeptide repeat protein [Streptomyces sp. NPDC059875]|uniref:tetratricopeptide repeat protein n=1 Tax=unclassified Streptomyces TaxID=2593676 RepID=UPI00364B665C
MTPLWPRKKPQTPDPARIDVRRGVVARDAAYSALGPNSTVIVNEAPAQGADAVAWPLELGAMPTLASAFQPREILRERVDAARAEGEAAVLTQVLAGGGGVGKSQLAASYAAQAVSDGTDLVLWVTATEIQQVVTLYAQAAVRVAAPGATGERPESDAKAFLSWLATTPRRWLVVLDDITDPAGMEGWWPTSRTGSGWVLATTRLHDAVLTGGGRRRINIDVYSASEAAAYLRARLAGDDAGRLLDAAVDELAAALGYLPLALGHAAAYMINQGLSCAAYLARFTDRTNRLDQLLPATADTEGYGRQIAATLLLSLDAAQRAEPAGLAQPALRLAALLDPAGHPKALWDTPAVLDHLTERGPVTPEQAHAALRTLHRYALLTCDADSVRIHALTARAVREATPTEELSALVTTAADALVHIWPDPDQPQRDLAATLRANTDVLAALAGDLLWQSEGHLVLYRAGRSLLDAGLAASAMDYWQNLAAVSERVLGSEHPEALAVRASLAFSFWLAGRADESIVLEERVLAVSERVLGAGHPGTLAVRANLASSYWLAGRIDEAVVLQEGVLADRERVLGPEHPDTLTARANLASTYSHAGRVGEAIVLQEGVLADRERVLGPEHPDTLTARANLGSFYWRVGRVGEAVVLEQGVLADRERVLGPEHPDTLTARANLSYTYRQAGLTTEATALMEQALAGAERALGSDHPDTVDYRAALLEFQRKPRRLRRLRRLWRRNRPR